MYDQRVFALFGMVNQFSARSCSANIDNR